MHHTTATTHISHLFGPAPPLPSQVEVYEGLKWHAQQAASAASREAATSAREAKRAAAEAAQEAARQGMAGCINVPRNMHVLVLIMSICVHACILCDDIIQIAYPCVMLPSVHGRAGAHTLTRLCPSLALV